MSATYALAVFNHTLEKSHHSKFAETTVSNLL